MQKQNNNSFRNPKINEAFTRSSRAEELMSSEEPSEVKKLQIQKLEELTFDGNPAYVQTKILPSNSNRIKDTIVILDTNENYNN